MTGTFGLRRYGATPDADDRDLLLLRLLGRLKYLDARQVHALAFPDYHWRSVYKRLDRLREHGLIWGRSGVMSEERARALRVPGKRAVPPPKPPVIYWLTPEGKNLLHLRESEPDAATWELLHHRTKQGRPPRATLPHDLQVSWWCASLLLEARQNGFCHNIYIQTEFTVHKEQRVDALIMLRLNLQQQRATIGQIPLFDGSTRREADIELRFCLEVDGGTEQLTVLMDKAFTYRNLSHAGIYDQLVGGPVLPVFLAPSPLRATNIAQEFRHAWPNGWGVISTPEAADHRDHGVLWGDYLSMVSAEPFQLLTTILPPRDPEHSVAGPRFHPVIALERWREGMTRVQCVKHNGTLSEALW